MLNTKQQEFVDYAVKSLNYKRIVEILIKENQSTKYNSNAPQCS